MLANLKNLIYLFNYRFLRRADAVSGPALPGILPPVDQYNFPVC